MSMDRYTYVPEEKVYSTFVDPPYQSLLAAGESKQKRYNFGKGLEQELGALGQQIKAIPHDQERKNNVVSGYNSQLKDLVDQNKDYSSPEFQKKASDLIYKLKNDKEVQSIMGNYDFYEKHYEKYKGDIKNSRDIDNTYKYDSDGNPVQNKTGVNINKLTAVGYSDPTKDALSLMANIKPNSTEYEGYDKNSDGSLKVTDGYLYKRGNAVKQVTGDDVMKFASKNIDAYAQTDGGRYLMAKVLNKVGIDPLTEYESLDSRTKQYVDQQLGKQLIDIGSKEIFKDTKHTEGITEDYKSKSDYERKSKEQTSVVAGGTSGSKFDVNIFKTNKVTYQGQLDALNQQLANSKDVNSQAQIKKQITSVNTKLRMQDDLIESALKQSGWNWEDKFKDFKSDVATNIGTAQANALTINDFKNLTKGSQQDFYAFMNKNSNFGSQTSNTAVPVQGVLSTFGKWNGVYNKTAENSMQEYTSQHDMLLGSDDSYAGIISKRMTAGVDKGNIELMNEDGTQFSKDKQLSGYTKELNMVPLKSPIGGKPGYAITGKNSDGDSKTFYVTMDDDTAGLEDYRQTANDLIEQSKTSKYASDPYKASQLKNTGYLQYGYAVLGPQINDAQLQTMSLGDKRDLDLENGKLTITAKGDKGNVYYNVAINGTLLPGNYGNEQSLMQAIGELEYKANVEGKK